MQLTEAFNRIQTLIEAYNINLINLIFIIFTITIVIFGSLITLVEKQLPASIRQSFRYGKHSYKGATDPIVSRLELPKSCFKHFYIFAYIWALLACFLIGGVVITQKEAHEYVLSFLDFMAGGAHNRRVQIDSNTAVLGTALLTMQCARRFYETNFVQIFSKHSKINLSHYIVGYVHYFGAIIALLCNTAGFVRGTRPAALSLANINGIQIACVAFFVAAWHQQYLANLILVNLRKDAKTGLVKTEQHLMPRGGSFNLVSSPHMFFEIVMYFCLALLQSTSTAWWLIFIWVASNQVTNALLTHQWYHENFKLYPKQRRAIFPFIL